MDDFRLSTDSKGGMIKLKGELNEKFQMTELGEMKKILGINILNKLGGLWVLLRNNVM